MFRPRPTIVSELEQLIVQFKNSGCDSSETALQMLSKCQELTLSFQTAGWFGSEFTPTKTASAPRGRPAKKKYDSDDSGSDSSSLSDSESEESVEESRPKKVAPKMAKPKKSFGGDGGSEESDSDSESGSGSSEEEPKIKTKKLLLKKKKDPNAPKRPMSAYLLFSLDKREAYRREHPEARIIEVTRALGELWKASSDADKQVYQEKAQQEKLRYEEEMRQYQSKISKIDEPHDAEPKKKKVASPMKKAISDKEGSKASPAKRPKSAYMIFVTEKRNEVKEQHPELGFADLAKQMAVMWKDMSEDAKKIWADKAAADMERYQRECAE